MRDHERELWESDPDRSLVQSAAWNLAVWIWSLGWSITIFLLALFGFLPRNWKAVLTVMGLAFGSGSLVQVAGHIFEKIKYRDR